VTVTGATDMPSRFLGEAPTEVRGVLDWFNVGEAREVPPPHLAEFAGEFLGAMHDDGAVLPEIRADTALQTLALVLLHHVKSPESAGAWLNLGLGLRRMALYRTQDSEQVNRRRLCDALEALERSLQLDPDNVGKNIRAWTGESFAYHVLGLYEDEVRCCLRALEADRSDPKLWLLYGFALRSAGRKGEALSVMDDAYHAYVEAGEPEELRNVFAGIR
jgi:tetratricopeptide (TPR) repeat protein